MGLIEDLKGVDFNDMGSWSRQVKVVMTIIVGVLIIVAGYHFIIKDQKIALEKVQAKEQDLRKTFLEKKELAVNLDAYKAQIIKAKENFDVLKDQLPNESEIPDLLIDMTQVGLARGLQFEQIRPGNAVAKEFYAEKPVNITANGDYHQIAGFISDIASLPRIINVADFTITRKSDDESNLTIQAVTKTYHYLDDTYVEEEQ